ncbi:MAG TPA: 3-carboxy-cis,cis-muconate cycloisomerase [Stellaceae bacterium]|nr:3-carboxy-cis,cis-muconate cycloisomerase [Stellaceae bacterium]
MSVNPADSEIFGGLFGTDEMRAVFDDRRNLQKMLDVEAALARVQARLGIIPAGAAEAITAAASVERIKLAEIAASVPVVGYPVVAVAKALGRAAGGDAARYVHWGATTQDIMDTAVVLQVRDGLALIGRDIAAIVSALADMAESHRDTVMTGRTHLQHALPVTFGYKCAVWLAPFIDHLARFTELKQRALTVQFGGAVGTLASLGGDGRAVTTGLAAELGLTAPLSPWHVSRERLVEVAALLALVCGSLAKIATDVMLLMQTELGEVFEPHQAGRGGSSTMPQKRNPIASEYVLAATRGVHALLPLLFNAMAQDQERATGPWQSEQLALPQIFVLTAGALAHGRTLAEGLTVDAAAMRRNLDATHGLIMAEAFMMELAEKIGRDDAHHAIQHACGKALEEDRFLVDVLAEDPDIAVHLDRDTLERLADPAAYLGEARDVVDRVVAGARAALAGVGARR